jgi:hypothetical protein
MLCDASSSSSEAFVGAHVLCMGAGVFEKGGKEKEKGEFSYTKKAYFIIPSVKSRA